MRRLALLLLIAAVSPEAAAQDLATGPLAPEVGSVSVVLLEDGVPLASDTLRGAEFDDALYVAALGASSLAILGGIPLARKIGDLEGVAVVVVAVPLAAALGTQLMSDRLGLEGSFGGALGNAFLGAVLGTGAGLATGFVIALASADNTEILSFAGWTAISIAAAGPGFYAARRRARLNHVAGPVLQVRADGRLAPGLALRVGL